MAFTNPTDYPDFTALGQSGSGIIYSTASLNNNTVGPFYVGNLPAFTFQCIPGSVGSVDISLWDTVDKSGLVYALSTYDMRNASIIWDEIKVGAPYLFISTTGNATSLQIAASLGTKGAPAVNNNNYLLEEYPVSLAAGASTSFFSSTVIPGPAIVCGYAAGGGIPLVRVFDAAGGVLAAPLGYGQGPASVLNQSGVNFEIVAPNNAMQVNFYNHGGALDAVMGVTIVSKRGF